MNSNTKKALTIRDSACRLAYETGAVSNTLADEVKRNPENTGLARELISIELNHNYAESIVRHINSSLDKGYEFSDEDIADYQRRLDRETSLAQATLEARQQRIANSTADHDDEGYILVAGERIEKGSPDYDTVRFWTFMKWPEGENAC